MCSMVTMDHWIGRAWCFDCRNGIGLFVNVQESYPYDSICIGGTIAICIFLAAVTTTGSSAIAILW